MVNSKKLIIKTIVAIVVVAAMVLYFFVNPEDYELIPKCVLKQLTGYDCPSCGAQRAFHAVLHGNFTTAIYYTPFFVISVPYFLLVLYATFFKNIIATQVRKIAIHKYAIYTYIVLYFAWWIVRNIWF